MSTLTSMYPFRSMSVGDTFRVLSRFQHCRVAASDYSRKHGYVFTCRMQDDGTMLVHRVSNDQKPIDQRGSRGRRRIVVNHDPTQAQFAEWLATFAVGQSYSLPASYGHLFLVMDAWTEIYSLRSGRQFTTSRVGDNLLITLNKLC